jgi:hypothetical protein
MGLDNHSSVALFTPDFHHKIVYSLGDGVARFKNFLFLKDLNVRPTSLSVAYEKPRGLTMATREEKLNKVDRFDLINKMILVKPDYALATHPPSTGKVTPVTQALALDARKIAAPAASCGCPARPLGILFAMASISAWAIILVGKKPGAILLTFICSGARVADRCRVK